MTSSGNGEEGPVFVVGMNGSGTTMLIDHLNHHTQLFGFAKETRILPYFIAKAAKYGDLEDDANFCRLWGDMAQATPFWQANRRKPVPLPDDWKQMQRGPAAIFDRLLKYFASQEGKTRWCEKTPMHVSHIAKLGQLYPDARFIHIIRDGRDCAASFHRRWGYSPFNTIYRWKQAVTAGQTQGRIVAERYYEVRYEDITARPEQEMRRICDFLGVEFESAVLLSSRNEVRNAVAPKDGIEPNSQKFKHYFGVRKTLGLERIAGRKLNELGYDVDFPDGDRTPPGIMLTIWRFNDYTRQAIGELRRKKDSGGRRSWGTVLRRFKSAIQQKITNNF